MPQTSKKTALISVFNKEGIVPFARELIKLGINILSTGGTYKLLKENKIEVREVADYTGFSEIMDGRVKTLHPKIHGGILAVRDNKSHLNDLIKNKITPIDMVVINLYPFIKTIKKENVIFEEAIEMIDIGGPSMLRSAAKNYKFVTPVCDPKDYEKIIKELKKYGETKEETRRELAVKVFKTTYHYDQAIADYLSGNMIGNEPLDLHYEKAYDLRYGENPHQKAIFFRNPQNDNASNVTNAKILHGKQLSFNNILDSDAAIELVREFKEPTAVFVKHTNPCGVAGDKNIEKAFIKAHKVDPMSAFGCVIAINRECNLKIVDYIFKNKIFIEIVAAPSFEKKALQKLMEKKNLRIVELGKIQPPLKRRDIKKVAGGILIQTADIKEITKKDLQVVTKKKPTEKQIEDLLFAAKIVKHVKSNSVVFAKNHETTGIGAGQMSRVDSVFIATHKGGKKIKNSVMASDAFFPFPDAVEEAHKAGVSVIIQPGGSIRDQEVIEAADKYGISMVFTGIRSFKH